MPYDENGEWYDDDSSEMPPDGLEGGYDASGMNIPGGGYYPGLDDPPPLDPLEPSWTTTDFGGYDPYGSRVPDNYDPTPSPGGSNRFLDFLKNFKFDSGSGNGLASSGIMAGKSAGAAAAGRKSEAEILNDLMRNQISRGQLEINQKKYAAEVPQTRAQTSMLGSQLANVQDVNIQPWNSRIKVPTVTGGKRPSMLSADTRALGRELSRSALASQLAPDTFTPINDPSYPKAGFMEKLNTGISDAQGIGGTIWDIIKALDPNAK